MAPIAESFVRLRPDAGPRFSQEIEHEVGPATEKAGRTVGQRFGKSMGGGIKVAIGGLAILTGGALTAGAAIKRGLIDPASDLAETMSKVSNVFPKQARQIKAWSQGAAQSFGLSQQAALAAVGTFGDMFSQLGFTRKEASRTSRQLVKTAADLGSFHNVDPSDVLERIGASLRGEYDSLQQLIPNINAARVQTEALRLTGKKHAEQLTAQEKATATLAIIQKDGANAANDFAETSDGAANAQRRLSAQVEDLRAKLGAKLLPVFATVVDKVGEFITQMENGTGQGGKFRDALTDAAHGAKVLYDDVVLMVQGLRPVAALLKPLVGLLGDVGPVGQLAGLAFLAAGSGAAKAAPQISNLVTAIRNSRQEVGTGGTLVRGLRNATNIVGGPWGLAFAGGVAILARFAAKHAAAKVEVDNLSSSLDQVTGAITRETRAQVAQKLQSDGVSKAASQLGLSLGTLTDAALGNADAQDRVRDRIKLMSDALKAQVADGKATAAEYFAFRDAANKVTGAVGSSSKAFQKAQQQAAELRTALDQTTGSAYKLGKNFTTALARGIRAGGDVAIAEAQGVANKINAQFEKINEIKSPSKRWTRYGRFLTTGLADGIKGGTADVVSAVSDLTRRSLADLEQRLDRVKGRVDELKGSARGIRDSVGSAIRGSLDVSALRPGPGALFDVKAIAAKASAFATALGQLAQRKIAPSLIEQIALAGPDAGMPVAQSFLALGRGQRRELNAAYAQIDQAARRAGNSVVDAQGIQRQIAHEQRVEQKLERLIDAVRKQRKAVLTVKGDGDAAKAVRGATLALDF